MRNMLHTGLRAAGFAALLAGPALAGPGAPHHHAEETAYGMAGDPKKPARLVLVTMREGDGKMIFIPDAVQAKVGEQLRFRLVNSGALAHEFVLATVDENRRHAAEMAKNPDMEHDDPNAARVAPGRNGEIVWKFTKPGTFEFACLIPGHLEAGMHGTITVK